MISPINNGNTPASTMTKREMMALHIYCANASNAAWASISASTMVRESMKEAELLLAELAKPQRTEL